MQMNWISKFLFGDQIMQQAQRTAARPTTNLFNEAVFRYLSDGEVIIKADNYNYVTSGYEAVGAVYECVDIIVKKMIACPRVVYRIKDQKEYKKYLNFSKSADTLPQMLISKAKALEEVSIPQIDRLLTNPNPEQDGDTVYEHLFARYLLQGNAYLYGEAGSDANIKAKKWNSLRTVPGEMTIISGGWQEPVKEYILQQFTQDKPFPADQIKHFRTLNPNYNLTGQQLYGLPPLKAYLYSLDILKNADKQADKQMKNGGAMAIVSPKNKEDAWAQAQIDQFGTSLKDAHKSKNAMDRTIPVSIGLDYQRIGLSSAELELISIANVKADDVYRAMHMPLQFRSQDTATYNNLPVANRQMVYNAVAPPCRRFSVGLTDFICQAYNTAKETYIIEIDYTALPELHDDTKAIVEWLMLCDFLTPNEKREVLGWGRSAEPGMDEYFINKNKVRLTDIMAGVINTTPSDPQAGDTSGQSDTGMATPQ